MTTGRAALACHQSHVHSPNKSLCRPQSSSASRVTAAQDGFFILSQSGEPPRTVSGVLALRHDTFKPHLAGMGEDGRAIAFDMLVEPHAGTGAATGPKLER
jgi:hypothetical protein